MKRQRGRGRKPGGGHHNHHQPNRALESNGPEVKVRGPASHIYERYLQLARDAASSGDRVLSENYLQHADHYFRLVRAMQPAMPVQPAPDRFANEGDFEGDEEAAPEAEAAEEGEAAADASSEQPDVEFPQGQQPQQFERGEGEFRRRRGRRNRYRPDGEREGGEPREGARQERAEGGEVREERRERRPRDQDRGGDDQAGPEGFSSGPRPAFLRSD